MAIVTYKESDLQNYVHSMYEGDTDTPASDDDDYLYRRRLLNAGINRWENNRGTLWNELWTNTATESSGATLTVASGTTNYPGPDDMRFPAGYLNFLDDDGAKSKTVTLLKPEQVQEYPDNLGEVAYIRGNYSSGFEVVIGSGLASDYAGKTLSFDYYKRADILTGTNSVPEMADPFFLVHYALAELYKQDNNVAFYTSHLRESEERLKQMEIQNMMTPHYQGINVEEPGSGVMGM